METGLSILSNDFSRLGDELKKYGRGPDFIHMDIMDGSFVPNLTFGPPLIDSLRKITALLFEAHLMVVNPAEQWKWYKKSCGRIIFHIEALREPQALLKEMKGVKKGIALNPATPAARIEKWLPYIETAFLMSVPPGFSGQKFDSGVLEKISRLRKIIDRKKLKCRICVDGGINLETAALCRGAGADSVVASSYLSGGNILKKLAALKALR
ncbi:ribulose-phosphate 3-epimerase [bacterium]|nr:ribulose-phosphate 3-epimerase [bacterium]MBU3956550.1 ribulose-phosphate 3-epimerase [bacterium]MBU4134448.1 ribulose-phosphate 3-epimerase [bacterium]